MTYRRSKRCSSGGARGVCSGVPRSSNTGQVRVGWAAGLMAASFGQPAACAAAVQPLFDNLCLPASAQLVTRSPPSPSSTQPPLPQPPTCVQPVAGGRHLGAPNLDLQLRLGCWCRAVTRGPALSSPAER